MGFLGVLVVVWGEEGEKRWEVFMGGECEKEGGYMMVKKNNEG